MEGRDNGRERNGIEMLGLGEERPHSWAREREDQVLCRQGHVGSEVGTQPEVSEGTE